MELKSDFPIPHLDPKTELRNLHLSYINKLITILENGESWKKLMSKIPKQLSEHGFESKITLHNKAKFTSSHFDTIIRTSEETHRKATEILFQEWGTMGPRPRVSLGHLKYLLTEADLFAAATYVAELLGEDAPKRPAVGPAAAITIPFDIEDTTASTAEAHNNQDEEMLRQLDQVGYIQEAVEQIRSLETHHQQVQPVIPDIVITNVPPAPEPIQSRIVIQKPTPPSPTSSSHNPIDLIDTSPQEDEDTKDASPHENEDTKDASRHEAEYSSDLSGNIPNIDFLIQQPFQPVSLGEPSQKEISSDKSEATSNKPISRDITSKNSASISVSLPVSDNMSSDNIPALHIFDQIRQGAIIKTQENLSENVKINLTDSSNENSEEMMSNSIYNSTTDVGEYMSSESDTIPIVVQQYHNIQPLNTQSLHSNEIRNNSLYTSTSIPLVVQNHFESVKNDSHADDTPLVNLPINSPLPHYNYEVLEKATGNLSRKSEKYLGSGSFGSVFLAEDFLPQPVAVKKLNVLISTHDEYDVLKEFKREVENMHRYKHPNLVSLLGYSCDTDDYCLVYEFVSGGSLFDKLRMEPKNLNWVDRVKIALGTAKGVAHLHTAFEPPMVHRDVKSANILLDSNKNVKVCDYGISKLLPEGVTVIDTSPCGTGAYMPPEYILENKVSCKLDSYSFGVVVLELLTSLSPIQNGVDLVSYSKHKCGERKSIQPILDQSVGIWEHNGINFGTELYNVVLECLQTKEYRPLMTEIVVRLETLLDNLNNN